MYLETFLLRSQVEEIRSFIGGEDVPEFERSIARYRIARYREIISPQSLMEELLPLDVAERIQYLEDARDDALAKGHINTAQALAKILGKPLSGDQVLLVALRCNTHTHQRRIHLRALVEGISDPSLQQAAYRIVAEKLFDDNDPWGREIALTHVRNWVVDLRSKLIAEGSIVRARDLSQELNVPLTGAEVVQMLFQPLALQRSNLDLAVKLLQRESNPARCSDAAAVLIQHVQKKEVPHSIRAYLLLGALELILFGVREDRANKIKSVLLIALSGGLPLIDVASSAAILLTPVDRPKDLVRKIQRLLREDVSDHLLQLMPILNLVPPVPRRKLVYEVLQGVGYSSAIGMFIRQMLPNDESDALVKVYSYDNE